MYKRINRWKFLLEEYNYKIEYIKGKENILVDHLSRNPSTPTENSNTQKNNLLQHIKYNMDQIRKPDLLFTLPQFDQLGHEELKKNCRTYTLIWSIPGSLKCTTQ
ncbi:Retrovirus-related Pol polyprotein from transposon [Dictyocoela roeselum]|nr:Retrovirus-related Pol polyprotein from transposon [Dictyocoela roeselum]